MEEMQYLQMLEAILVQHRAFGDSDYLHKQLQVCYERRLTKISARLPAAGALLDALCRTDPYTRYRIIGDTVVRFAINDALRLIQTEEGHGLPLDHYEELFHAMVRCLKDNKFERTLLSGTPQIQCGEFALSVWAGQHFCGPLFEQAFLSAVKERCGGLCEAAAELCMPNADHLVMLSNGVNLLNDLLPLLTRSALRHTHLIALFPSRAWKSAASLSQIWLSGTVFLGREFLQNPWWVAEHLLHESLHQRLYDFHQGHSFLTPDFSREDAPSVCSLWNVPGANKANCWDTHRAVAAFHVYVHLALLSAVAEQRAPELEKVYGSPHANPAMIDSRKAIERAQYLGEKIRESCWQELGIAGKRLVEWLISVLNALDPLPPPKGCYTHLLLDRYQGEGWTVQQRIDASSPVRTLSDGSEGRGAASSTCIQELLELANGEIDSTRQILTEIGAADDLTKFNHAINEYSYEELGTKFGQVRQCITKTILHLFSNGYRLKTSSDKENRVQEIVTNMVEMSSADLHVILQSQEA